jgi:two-component system, chemotaxis family, sensor kinase Cph1
VPDSSAKNAATPAFGQADLSNCEREQIHLAGSIQPHGALLLVREPDHVILQASANAAEFLHLPGRSAKDLLGHPVADLPGDLLARIREHAEQPQHALPKAVRCHVGEPAGSFDGLFHRLADGGLVIELEPAGPAPDLSRDVHGALQEILAAPTLRALCDETARIFRRLAGYDRTMVYRFDDDGHGEVFSEQRTPELEAFLGNWYPASDIPQIARRLYERTRIRVLSDVAYTPVPLVPRLSPITGEDLDMSLCFLRSISPIHVQYLKNMGVRATLVVSLVVGGKLWGLISCHHYVPRFVHFELRSVCELLAEAIATRIAALESFVQGQAELAVRRLEQRMIEAISRDGDWRASLFDSSQSLLRPLDATGVALLFEGQTLTAGEVPATQHLREIGIWLDGQPRGNVIATAKLGIDQPEFAHLTGMASGLIATPISTTPGEYLVWFRPERVRTVTWGGNPFKPVIVGDDPSSLSPRRSFSQWHQLVERTAEPWTPADLRAVRTIGDTVSDVVLQFRAVRVLIAQDQLSQIRRQVRLSDQPVIIADPNGRVLLINEAFEHLLSPDQAQPHWIEDLPELFVEPLEVREKLRDLLAHSQTWRGEVRVRNARGVATPMLVRADPVFSSPGRVLGFVFLFTDVTERKIAEAARGRFQEGIIDGHRNISLRLDSKAAVLFQNLLSAVIENAQLAALEITDGMDTARMPALLDGVRASVARTAEVLQHLVSHAADTSDKDPDRAE